MFNHDVRRSVEGHFANYENCQFCGEIVSGKAKNTVSTSDGQSKMHKKCMSLVERILAGRGQ